MDDGNELDCKGKCHIIVVITVAVVFVCWLCLALYLCNVRKKKNLHGKQTNGHLYDLPSTNAAQRRSQSSYPARNNSSFTEDRDIYQNASGSAVRRDSLVYTTVVFKEGKQTPASQSPKSEEVTYASVNLGARDGQVASDTYAQVAKKKA